jgi:hypothetical protein
MSTGHREDEMNKPMNAQDEARLAALVRSALPPVRLNSPQREDLARRLRLETARFGQQRRAGIFGYMGYLLRENEAGAVWSVMAAGLSRFLRLGGTHPAGGEQPQDRGNEEDNTSSDAGGQPPA